MARARGAEILYPKFTERYDHEGKHLHFKDGTSIAADVVIISIGETPELDYLPEDMDLERGFVRVDSAGQTTDPKVFAIGDVTQPGLITNAIGRGTHGGPLRPLPAHEDRVRGGHEARSSPTSGSSYQWYERSRRRTCQPDRAPGRAASACPARAAATATCARPRATGGRSNGRNTPAGPTSTWWTTEQVHRVRVLRRGVPLRHLDALRRLTAFPPGIQARPTRPAESGPRAFRAHPSGW